MKRKDLVERCRARACSFDGPGLTTEEWRALIAEKFEELRLEAIKADLRWEDE